MQLQQLLERLTYTLVQGSLDLEIEDILYDSRKAAPGRLFVAIDGFRTDSHRFLPQVAEKGISAVAVEKEWEELPEESRLALENNGVTVLKVSNGREALALLSAAFFGYPTEKMTVVGITGTKGKSTVANMLAAILRQAGQKVGVIGTIGVEFAGRHIYSVNTTPEPYLIHQYAREMVEAGCTCLVLETSSSGIKYHRIDGIHFDLGLFTNISPDHISPLEHPDFEDYLTSKARLFSRCRVGIFNRDEALLPEFLSRSHCQIHTYGLGSKSPYSYPDLAGEILEATQQEGRIGSRVLLNGSEELFVGIPGDFNVYNALAAVEAARLLGVDWGPIRQALQQIVVNGRVETVWSGKDCTVLIDYAHNGMSAEALLRMLHQYRPNRLVVVFGSVGERAQNRRLELGEVCGRLADLSIITADSPGWEPVEDIARDIHKGLDPTGGRAVDIPDRREAIRYALSHMEPGDMIAVIGKGHEEYQDIRGEKIPYSDREEILSAVKDLGLGS